MTIEECKKQTILPKVGTLCKIIMNKIIFYDGFLRRPITIKEFSIGVLYLLTITILTNLLYFIIL